MSKNQNNFYKRFKNNYRKFRSVVTHYYNVCTDHKPKLIILLYHRILPEIGFDPFGIVVTPKTFKNQIDVLSKKYPIISLSEAVKQCQSGEVKSKVQVVLTFDDGYKDNYEVAYPVLKKIGLPATFFVVTNYISSNKPLWEWEVINILNNSKIDEIIIDNKAICRSKKEDRLPFVMRVFRMMKFFYPVERQKIIDFLKGQSEGNHLINYEENACMTWEQVREIAQSGMEIGAHGMYHRSLARMSLEEARNEIAESKKIIKEQTQKDCIHFAFPFGSKEDFNQVLVDAAKDIGFHTCLLNIRGYNHIKSCAFCFNRITMEESTNLQHLY